MSGQNGCETANMGWVRTTMLDKEEYRGHDGDMPKAVDEPVPSGILITEYKKQNTSNKAESGKDVCPFLLDVKDCKFSRITSNELCYGTENANRNDSRIGIMSEENTNGNTSGYQDSMTEISMGVKPELKNDSGNSSDNQVTKDMIHDPKSIVETMAEPGVKRVANVIYHRNCHAKEENPHFQEQPQLKGFDDSRQE